MGNRWMFTGREWLAEVGLYDYRNRVYSAGLARFLQTDPIRFAANDVNMYRYVGNNYTGWTDPSGLNGDLFGAGPGDDPLANPVGRTGSVIVERGGFISTVIQEYVPGGYTFGQIHDQLVGDLTGAGVPDLFANVPSMPLPYAWALSYELVGVLGDILDGLVDLWNWLTE